MTEHLSSKDVENYRRRQLDAAALREIDSHLASCQTCLESLLNSEHSSLAFESLNQAFLPETGLPFHLSRAELKSYINQQVDAADKIIYASHLEDCEQCAIAVKSLSETASAQLPAGMPPMDAGRTDRSLSGFSWLTPSRAIAAFAMFAIIAVATVVFRRQQSQHTEPVAQFNPPANSTSSPSSTPANQATPEPVSTASVRLKDGDREIRLENDGRVSGLESFDESTRQVAQAALRGEALAKPKVLGELPGPTIKLLGPPEEETFQLVDPIGSVVTENQPTLRWRPLSGAETYIVSIFDGNFNRVARSNPLETTRWKSSLALPRGQTYSWEVSAVRDGKEFVSPAAPSGAAKFAIIDERQLQVLAQLKRQTPVSHLVLGIEYARAGLLSDAEREFRQLVRENPDSQVAKRLLRTVQAWR